MYSDEILQLAQDVVNGSRDANLMVAVAESCTGGLVSGALTAVSGSSDVFDRGYVTYSYKAKSSQLGVPQGILVEHGAVSEEVALLMAEGALANSIADLAVAITGIAGPGGGTPDKPVGRVCFAVARIGQRTRTKEYTFDNTGRHGVRMQSVKAALDLLKSAL